MKDAAVPCSVSAEDVAAFERDGVVCIRRAVGSGLIEQMRTATDRVLESQTHDVPTFRTLLYLWENDPDFRAFSLESSLPEMAGKILQSREVRLFADQLLVKESGSVEKTPWHQDQPYWPLSGSQLCTIWVALDPVTLENGAVEYIRGSHRWGKWYKPEGFSAQSQIASPDWDVIPDFDKLRDWHDFVHWDVEPGDAIIHHPLIVHGAGGNLQANCQRRAIAPRYAGDDVRWNPAEGMIVRRNPELAPGATLVSPLFPLAWAEN
jgi:ectoine hydroxylase-related dioxygenase (phytanoyl-CoA dioxygenase family)